MRRVALALLLTLTACGQPRAPAPHQIHIVGASAGFPFSSIAAEQLMREDVHAIAPLVRAGGSGEGIARFCDGPGRLHPDLLLATRSMTPGEARRCAADGVGRVASVPIGFTALVLVARRDAAALALTRGVLAAALTGRATIWSQLDPRLPAIPIGFAGPAPDPAIADGLFALLAPGSSHIRHDGYAGYGADAERVVRAVAATPNVIGILPYAQAWQHRETLRILTLDGVAPNPGTIAQGRYPASAPLLLLVKRDAIADTPALPRLLALYAKGLAPGGAFAGAGLVPLAEPDAASRQLVALGAR